MSFSTRSKAGAFAIIAVVLGIALWFVLSQSGDHKPNTAATNSSGKEECGARPWRIHVNGPAAAVARARVVLATVEDEYIEATALGSGEFRSPVPPSRLSRGFAVTPTFRSQTVHFGSSNDADCVLTLTPTASVHVRVETETGIAVANARLIVGLRDSAESNDWIWTVRHVADAELVKVLNTNPDGESELPMLMPGMSLTVRAENDSGIATSFVSQLALTNQILLVLKNGGQRVSIHCRRLDGSPAPNVALRFDLLGGSPGHPVYKGAGACSTDETGVAKVFLGEAAALYLTGIESGWRFKQRPEVLTATNPAATVVIMRVFAAALRIMYDDGVPYYNGATIQTPTAMWDLARAEEVVDSPRERSSSLPLSKEGRVTVPEVVEGDSLQLHVTSSRVEYESQAITIPPEQLSKGGEIVVLIPKLTEAKILGRVRLTGEFPNDALAAITDDPWMNPIDTFALSERHDSRGLPAARQYKVRVSASTLAWESEVFSLANGETKVIQVPNARAASVRVRVVDAKGNPISGAALMPYSRRHAVFPQQAEVWLTAITDADGVAELGGQPSGNQEYRVEASGKQFRRVRVLVNAGVANDLGQIVLEPAIGEIWIELPEGVPEGERIEVELKTPFGTQSLWATQEITRRSCVFRDLPTDRSYILLLIRRTKDKRRGIFIINGIELTPTRAIHEISVALSEFKFD